MSVTARDRRLAIMTLTSAGVNTGAGSIRGNNQHRVTASEFYRSELFGAFATGIVRHERTLGLTTTKKTQDPVFTQNYTTQGQLTRQLAWQTSAQLLNPRFRNVGAAYDGKAPENASKKTGSAFVSYDIAQLPGLPVNTGACFTGRRPVNDLDQASLGGVTLWSAGARYVTPVMGYRGTVQFNVENLGDKPYWAGAGPRLAAGAPRTYKLTLKVDL